MGRIGGAGVTRGIDGPTSVAMAMASVSGVAACVATVVGAIGETSIGRAVLCMVASCDGSILGGGLSP